MVETTDIATMVMVLVIVPEQVRRVTAVFRVIKGRRVLVASLHWQAS